MYYTRNIFTIFIIYLAASLLFLFSVSNYGESQKQKELLKLQSHLSSFMDIRSNALANWIKDKSAAVDSVSENLTVKMYLDTASANNISQEDLLTQQQFTAAYLESVAKNYGFKGSEESNIRANVAVDSHAAIMLVNKIGKPLLSIDHAENLVPVAGDLGGLANEPNISFAEAGGATYIKIIEPITKIQSDEITGYVMAIKKLDKGFFEMLNFPPSEYKTLKSQLLLKKENQLNHISAEAPETPIMIIDQNQDLGEVYAINNPDLISEKDDIHGNRVFISARKIGDFGIYLVQSLSYAESFSDVIQNARNIKRISFLMVLLLGALMSFVWKHSVSEKYKKLYAEVQEKQRLLKLISENQIQTMFLLDSDNEVVFANKMFVTKNKIKEDGEYLDKPLASVIGVNAAEDYINLAFTAHDTNLPVTSLAKMMVKDHERFIQRKVIPIATEELENNFTGSLVIENDISDLMNERVKYEKNLNNSIQILVKIIENRSKYFYNHGEQVHNLSIRIADVLNIPEIYRKALDFASRISNLSLALLPRELINKQGELTEQEKEIFNSIPQKTIEIIRDFNFDSPVVETLEQINERVDGKGPHKLSSDQILISARIIKVVSDYVAMTSPRPYRDKLSSSQAVENLLKDKDTKYSKEVVFALANLVTKG